MKKLNLLPLFFFLFASASLPAETKRLTYHADLIAYDGFSGIDYGWNGVWSEFVVNSTRNRTYDDLFSFSNSELEMCYEHESGISVKGGTYNVKASETACGAESRALIRRPLDNSALKETFYVSFLVQLSEQPQQGSDYVAVGAKQFKYDSGVAIGSIKNENSLGAAFARDGKARTHFGTELPEANTTYFVVAKYITNSHGIIDKIACFINPKSLTTEYAEWFAVVDDVVTEMETIDLQAYFHGDAYFDEIRVGKTWASVVAPLDNSGGGYNPVGNVTRFMGPSGLWSDESKWSGGLPTEDTDTVIIEGRCIVNMPVLVRNLKVSANASLSVVGNGDIVSINPIVLEAEEGVVGEYSQDTAVVDHIIKKQVFCKGGQWNFICVPEDMTADELFPDLQLASSWLDSNADYWLLDYSQRNRALEEDGMIEVYDQNYMLKKGSGCIVWLELDKKRTFDYQTSNVENEVVTDNTVNAPLIHSGWNLVGNPFSHSMSYSEVFDSCEHNQQFFTGAVYIWDGVSYKVWSKGTGDGEARNIKPMEAFFVKRLYDDPASAVFVMQDFGPQMISDTVPCDKSEEFEPINNSLAIGLNLMKGVNSDYTYIKMAEGANVGFDERLDGNKVLTNRLEYPDHDNIYTVDGAQKFALNSVELENEYIEVPLEIDLSQAMDSLMLTFVIEGDSSYAYQLIDEEKMTIKNITHGDLFMVATENKRLIDDRFYVWVVEAPDDETALVSASAFVENLGEIRANSGVLKVKSLASKKISVFVIDLKGRICSAEHLNAGASCSTQLSNGIYLVRLSDGKHTSTQKIVMR